MATQSFGELQQSLCGAQFQAGDSKGPFACSGVQLIDAYLAFLVLCVCRSEEVDLSFHCVTQSGRVQEILILIQLLDSCRIRNP